MSDADQQKLMLIGNKESFLIMALEKKLMSEGIGVFFETANVDALSSRWDEAAAIALYLDSTEHIQPTVLHYLKDRMDETGKTIFLIGEKIDIDYVRKYISNDFIEQTFPRPLDTDKFIGAISGHMKSLKEGGQKKAILIVDDDPTYIGVIRDWLKGTYRVAMANSGMQAIKYLGLNKVDLILLDYEMPVTTGPQVLEMLRSESETASIPVIFLTGKSDRESVMKVLDLKPEGYLLKTIQKDELLTELAKFFKGR